MLYHAHLTLRRKPRRETRTFPETSCRLALILLVNFDKLLIVDKVATLTTENMTVGEVLIDKVIMLVKVIGDVRATAEEDAVKAAKEVSGRGADRTKTIETSHSTSVAGYARTEERVERPVMLHTVFTVILRHVRAHIHHFSFNTDRHRAYIRRF